MYQSDRIASITSTLHHNKKNMENMEMWKIVCELHIVFLSRILYFSPTTCHVVKYESFSLPTNKANVCRNLGPFRRTCFKKWLL